MEQNENGHLEKYVWALFLKKKKPFFLLHSEKVHRVAVVQQSPWLRTYVEKRKRERDEAKDQVTKEMKKFLLNSLYGKVSIKNKYIMLCSVRPSSPFA